MLRNIAFVQLDKALDMFLTKTYNKDANRFSQDKGVQNMLFEEELAILDYNTSIHMAEEKGEARGEKKGVKKGVKKGEERLKK